MNCSLSLISATNIDAKTGCSYYCMIFQPYFERFLIGVTNHQNKLEWDEDFMCHLIRGLDFKFYIYEKQNEEKKKTLIGKAYLSCFFDIDLSKGKIVELPIIQQRSDPTEQNSFLLVKLKLNPDIKPIGLQKPSNIIPLNNILYANLSFSPDNSPKFPLDHNLFEFVRIPFDISFISFDNNGQIQQILSNSEQKSPTKSCKHSKSTLCFCYDSFGPTIRIDLHETFFGQRNNSVRGIFVVSIFDHYISIEDFKWVSIDFYVSQENKMKRATKNHNHNFLICSKQLSDVYFHSRVPITAMKKGTTLSAAVAMTLGRNQEVEIEPVFFNVPNLITKIPTFSVTEILPEIAQVAQFPSSFIQYDRRVSCPLGCSASLSRALFINGVSSLNQRIRCIFSWSNKKTEGNFKNLDNKEIKNESELEGSMFALDKNLNVVQKCSMNHQRIFDNAIFHSGQMKSGLSEISIDLLKIPPNILFLCFAVTSFQKIESIFDVQLSLKIGNCVLYSLIKDSMKKQGMIFFVLKKEANDWLIVPFLKEANGKTPTLIQKKVIDFNKLVFLSH